MKRYGAEMQTGTDLHEDGTVARRREKAKGRDTRVEHAISIMTQFHMQGLSRKKPVFGNSNGTWL
jgi:hypothetical protein